MRRAVAAAAAALIGLAVVPASAAAHGLIKRADLPIPEWLFVWAAGVVLVVSFVALALLWHTPQLEGRQPERDAGSRRAEVLDVVLGAIGAALLVAVILTGLLGEQSPDANLTPTFVFVIFWVGLVPASVLFGDVFRPLNPWRALGRAVGSVAGRARERIRRPYPERLGRWPAAAGLWGFTWLELVATDGDEPRTIAIAALVYTVVTLAAMARYGAEEWASRGEAFGVYYNLFSRVSPLEWRAGRPSLRRPLSALTRLERLPGTVGLLAVMIGTVTYDGFSQGSIWRDAQAELVSAFDFLGASRALEVSGTIGLLAGPLAVYCFYRLGVAGARMIDRRLEGGRLALDFVHSLVPIAVVYVMAHYLTLLVFQGQALAYLVSDPAGRGWDLIGTADAAIDYSILSQNGTWYLQVGFVVAGHVAALTLAHDRALVVYRDARAAVRSQYFMLTVMVGFTCLALYLLQQANA